jgi:serine/threonine-protein kinase
MIVASVTAFVDCLSQHNLLKTTQLEEVTADLQRRFPEPRALAAELLQRGWLTPYQVNQLLQGKGQDLVLGSYVLLERLGEGGMGQVFKARHSKLDRLVALKLIRKDHLDNPEAVRRFQREIQAVAKVAHPNIVLAYDADQAGDVHFFVMEYIEGTDLAHLVLQSGPLAIPQACDYIRQAALGLQHACERGLVHRDIKPANLLLSKPGPLGTGLGQIKVSDLGLARWRRGPGDESSTKALTREGTVLGTLDYVAPEQAADSHAADIRADLYSLGCAFYFLLTGQVPFPGGQAIEKLYRHRFEEPVPVEQLQPEVPPAVTAIIRKLMAKQPENRYQTPAALAQELESLLQNSLSTELTLAPTEKSILTEVDRLAAAPPEQKMLHDFVLGNVAVVESQTAPQPHRQPARKGRFVAAAALGGFIVGGLLLYPWIGTQRPASSSATVAASTAKPTSPLASARIDTAPGGLTYAAKATREESILATLAANRLPTLEGKWRIIGPYDNTNKHAENKPFAPELAFNLDKSDTGKGGMTVAWKEYPAFQLGLVNYLGCESEGQPAPPSPSAAENACFYLHHTAEVAEAVMLPFAATCSGTYTIWLNGDLVLERKKSRWIFPQMDRGVLPLKSGKNQLLIKVCTGPRMPAEFYLLPLFPEKLQSAFGDKLKSEPERQVTSQRFVMNGHTTVVLAVALSPDGKLALSGGDDQVGRLWDLSTGQELRQLAGHKNPVAAVAFTADSSKAVTASGQYNPTDNLVRLWNVATGTEIRPASEGHQKLVTCLALTPDGKSVLSGSWDSTVRLWDLTSGKQQQLFQIKPNTFVTSLALSPDGNQVLIGCRETQAKNPTLRLWDVPTAREVGAWHAEGVLAVAFSADGRHVASASQDRTLRLWNLDNTKQEVRRFVGHTDVVRSLAISKDGNWLLSGSTDKTIRLWNVKTGKELRRFIGHTAAVRSVAFSADERSILSGSDDKTVRLWALSK